MSVAYEADQLVLLDLPRARATDPPTSHAAASAQLPHVGSQENRVLERFAIYGAMTDDELVARSPQWHGPTIKTCRSRLAKRGLLVPTGETRLSQRGQKQRVWRIA